MQARVKKTILFVSHDLDEALRLGDRISIMRHGRIVQTGAAQDIVLRPADDYVAEFVRRMNPLKVLTGAMIMRAREMLAGADGVAVPRRGAALCAPAGPGSCADGNTPRRGAASLARRRGRGRLHRGRARHPRRACGDDTAGASFTCAGEPAIRCCSPRAAGCLASSGETEIIGALSPRHAARVPA